MSNAPFTVTLKTKFENFTIFIHASYIHINSLILTYCCLFKVVSKMINIAFSFSSHSLKPHALLSLNSRWYFSDILIANGWRTIIGSRFNTDFLENNCQNSSYIALIQRHSRYEITWKQTIWSKFWISF